VHAVPLVHIPVALHVSGVSPLQDVWPGAHAPTHTPLTHVWSMQAPATPHWPFAAHVSTPLPEQTVVPAAQTPTHDPLTQVELTQALGAPHVPPLPQT
jgi:hypothetical protein